GVLGRYGGGTTWRYRLVTGELPPPRGSVPRPPGLRVTPLEQHRDVGAAETVWEAVADAFGELRALEHRIGQLTAALGEADEASSESLMDEYGHALERVEREGGYSIESRVDAARAGMGFDSPD